MDIIKQLYAGVNYLVSQQKAPDAERMLMNFSIEAINALANIQFQNLGDIDKAISTLELATKVDPNLWMSYSNLSHLLNTCHRFPEALEAVEKAIEKSDGDAADAHYNMGVILTNLCQPEEAIAAYRRGLLLMPNYGVMRYSIALLFLTLGRWKEGWSDYEWRLKSFPHIIEFVGRLIRPHWNGKDSLQGKTILVYNEQGLGDFVMLSRFIPKIKAMGATVIVEVQEDLVDLYSIDPSIDHVVSRQGTFPYSLEFLPHDLVVSVCSLPSIFACTDKTIPVDVPYIKPPEKCNSEFSFEPYKDKFKIGIAYSGCHYHAWDNLRSMYLNEFAPIAKIPNVQLFLLQKRQDKRIWANKEVDLGEAVNFNIVDLENEMITIGDLAHFVEKMDLIITVDTSLAHVAGALNKKMFVLIAKINDWRWGLGTDKSLWYPSAKVYRQTEYREWGNVFKKVAKDVKKLC